MSRPPARISLFFFLFFFLATVLPQCFECVWGGEGRGSKRSPPGPPPIRIDIKKTKKNRF